MDESSDARGRRRAPGYAVLAVLVVVGGGGLAAKAFDGSDPAPSPDMEAVEVVAPGITGLPTEVTCPGGEPPQGYDLDHSGYDSLDELLTEETRDEPFYGVDPVANVVWTIRPDGTAFERLGYTSSNGRWFPDGGESCAGAAPAPGSDLAIACQPDNWGIARATTVDTLTVLTEGRAYLHDARARQLYYVGPGATFDSTTIYDRPDNGWSTARMADCRTDQAAPEPRTEPPTDLTCPTELRNSGDIFTVLASSSPTIEEAAAPLLRSGESVAVEALGERRADAWILRADGTARLVLHFQRDAQRWWWDAYDSCDGDGPYANPESRTMGSDLTDQLDCHDQPVVTGTIGNPEATTGWEEPKDAIHWWLMGDLEVETHDGDSGSVIAKLVDPTGDARAAFDVREVDGHWQALALSACADSVPGLPAEGNPALLVALEVGHCWVEPLAAAGETWAPAAEDQFGWGGLWPRDFRGVGTFGLDGDVLVYLDAGGSTVRMLPTGDPRTDIPRICA